MSDRDTVKRFVPAPAARTRRRRWRRLCASAAMLAIGAATASAAPVAAGAAASGTAEGNTFVIRDVRIFDGKRSIERGSVLVVGGRIAAVGRIAAPPGIRAYDGRGRTVLPGLVDAHVHTDEEGRRDALRFGVTTQLDMFTDGEGLKELPAAKRQRRSLTRTDKADLWSAGIGVTVPGGHPTWVEIPRLTKDADPDRFVADRVREGSDYIKVIVEDGDPPTRPLPSLTPRQVVAVVTAAHKRHRLAVAHTEAVRNAKIAVAADADGLVHVPRDTTVDNAFAEEIRRRGAFVVPTLAVFDCGLGAKELLADERVKPYLSETQIAALTHRNPACQNKPSWHRIATENIRRLHAARVPILAGTDAPLVGTAHGVSLLAEIDQYVTAGLTARHALSAATSLPARRFGLADRGRVAPGLRADLLLVNGDPTRDVKAVRDIAAIWKNGYRVSRSPR